MFKIKDQEAEAEAEETEEYDFTLPKDWEIEFETPKCDCGAVIANAPIHSDWCSTNQKDLFEEEII